MDMDWKDVCPECDSDDIATESVKQLDNDRGYECVLLYQYSCNGCGCRWTVAENVSYSIHIDEHGDTIKIPC